MKNYEEVPQFESGQCISSLPKKTSIPEGYRMKMKKNEKIYKYQKIAWKYASCTRNHWNTCTKS